jgi:hypothetical protein
MISNFMISGTGIWQGRRKVLRDFLKKTGMSRNYPGFRTQYQSGRMLECCNVSIRTLPVNRGLRAEVPRAGYRKSSGLPA